MSRRYKTSRKLLSSTIPTMIQDNVLLSEIQELLERAYIPITDLISAKEASLILGISDMGVFMLVKRRKLRYITGTKRIDRRQVFDYLEKRNKRKMK